MREGAAGGGEGGGLPISSGPVGRAVHVPTGLTVLACSGPYPSRTPIATAATPGNNIRCQPDCVLLLLLLLIMLGTSFSAPGVAGAAVGGPAASHTHTPPFPPSAPSLTSEAAAAPHHQRQGEGEHGAGRGPADLLDHGLALRARDGAGQGGICIGTRSCGFC